MNLVQHNFCFKKEVNVTYDNDHLSIFYENNLFKFSAKNDVMKEIIDRLQNHYLNLFLISEICENQKKVLFPILHTLDELNNLGIFSRCLINDLDVIILKCTAYIQINSSVHSNTPYIFNRFLTIKMNGNVMSFFNARAKTLIELFDTELFQIIINYVKDFKMNIENDFHKSVIALFKEYQIIIPMELHEKNSEKVWEEHDLTFHTLSRKCNHPNQVGATFRFKNLIPSPLNFKNHTFKNKIQLSKPEGQFAKNDLPFQLVLEKRKSCRTSSNLLTLDKLNEFLYRVFNIKSVIHGDHYDYTLRNYPSGGSLHELEIYFYNEDCINLASGFYYYSPLEHAIYKIEITAKQESILLKTYKRNTGENAKMQIYFLITSRFERVSWKYQSMAYALTLKNVGVLYQTFYLVASAMNLSACALGSGESNLFHEITAISELEECPIGEFILGG